MYVKLAWPGLLRYLEATQPDLGDNQRSLLAHLINDEAIQWNIIDLAQREGLPRLATEALLVPYEQRELLQIARFLDNHTEVRGMSSLLKRELD
jgi:hypothetical protein